MLLNNGADIDIKNEEGETALRNAAENGHPRIVESLIKRGADIHTISSNTNTPLMLAAFNGNF